MIRADVLALDSASQNLIVKPALGTQAMAEPKFSNVSGGLDQDDDLPRTLRREREAQARRAREQEAGSVSSDVPRIVPDDPPPHFKADEAYDFEDPPETTVTRLEVPFFHLMGFFLKAVIAGIPALILLLAILWGIGEILTATFPELIKMQILIRMPN